MKIAYNPQTGAALTTVPSDNNNDIIFDLSGLAIYAKGVRFDGRAWTIFQKHTDKDNPNGYAGLVPAPSYTTTTTRFLREDGQWTEIPLLTAELYVGADKSMDQSATTNGNTFLNLFEAGICRSVIKLQGNNGILVSSDAFNNITIHSNITSDIVTLNNYNIATTVSSLANNDTLNTALGKLECKVDLNKGQIKTIMSLLGSIQNQVNYIEDNYVTLATDQTITGEKTFTQSVKADGFVKNGSSDDYVLLGEGGHKALEEFLLEEEFSERELTSNVIEESRTLKVTSDWMDTGITLDGTGTYVVQVSVYANNNTDNMWSCYWSGIMSWYGETTNDTDQYEEILLHRAGHAYNNTIYLRTAAVNTSMQLQIASNVTMKERYTFTFKFKRVL